MSMPGWQASQVRRSQNGDVIGPRTGHVSSPVPEGGTISGAAPLVGAGAVGVGGVAGVTGRGRAVGEVELKRPGAAPRVVEAVVGGRVGREAGLLLVDGGEQKPVEVKRARGLAVDRIERAGNPVRNRL